MDKAAACENQTSLASQRFLDRCLHFDIETNEIGEIYAIGASFRGKSFTSKPGVVVDRPLLAELDEFGREADFVLGHNIITHDIPRVLAKDNSLTFCRKPVIDTLYLSPLAYPGNPYHRLVKNYQIVRDSINDPVQDALLAGRVFSEQWEAFAHLVEKGLDAPLLYRGFFSHDEGYRAMALVLETIGTTIITGDRLLELFMWFAQDKVCLSALEKLTGQLADDKLAHPPLAYVTAWLTVAGGNSVLPPWVRHHFPVVPTIIHQLREQPCSNPRCGYCTEHHSPGSSLQKFYGFQTFREKPATEDGDSLQEIIIQAASRNTSIFATLPTGGGKSLCYLLPAMMRYQRHNALTIIISPLQALMKDQVDNFARQTGTTVAAALNGMLTMPERGEVLDRVRLGDVGILFVSPEQLRNGSFVRTISQREIGAWVFDEAHCLSKWGHDFRPDYLYSIRFIREFSLKEKVKIPPVQCFTATAKSDVQKEIVDIIQRELGMRVELFIGGHERNNLRYEVWPTSSHEKYQTILELLKARYVDEGSVIIYCATRKNTEKMAEFLSQSGYIAEAFHAGLEPFAKKQIQNDFISGDIPIICATNAFGMGIDKDNVRLVLHSDIPGSLENYLQEAGRAGRDRKEADCVLVFAEQDIEGQFRMNCYSRLTQKEIAQILRGLRAAARKDDRVVMTSGDILQLEEVELDLMDSADNDNTRVNIAVSWLERTGFLRRDENNTRVFQGKPLVNNLDEAKEKIGQLNLSERQKKRWLDTLALLMAADHDKGFSADELAQQASFGKIHKDPERETESQRVLRTLNDMANCGLLSKQTNLSAFIRYKVANSSQKLLERFCRLEQDFLNLLQSLEPDIELNETLVIDLRQVNQQLIDMGHDYSSPRSLALVLQGLSRDGKGLAGKKGSISLRGRGRDVYSFVLHREWGTLLKTVRIRQQAARVSLEVMHASLSDRKNKGATLLVDFTMEDIVESLRRSLTLIDQVRDFLALAERALTFMHEQGVIELQQGLAVFRQAMTITLNPEAKGKPYTTSHFHPLETYYTEKTFQVHVMNEYARRGLEKMSVAKNLVESYFNDEKNEFIHRFFPDRKKTLNRATSEQSYEQIVTDLNNTSQERIVAARKDRNMLILAGPGSGKTRTVAHRVAYLLRVERVRPGAILVLCFNRSAVMGLRKRLRDLVGKEMGPVTTLTYHGLALRLVGRSLVNRSSGNGEELDFSGIIKEAISLMKGEKDVIGYLDANPRDALLSRFSHILVDEYQDIDEEQYELVSLLAGKNLGDNDHTLSILAVGDDDQNIYRFRGTNVDFIRRFKEDYKATIHYLTENYRSTANIIHAANDLISFNEDRMKTDHPIRVNRARKGLPPGGNWQHIDLVARGKVQCLSVADRVSQAQALLEEIQRLRGLGTDVSLNQCAVLAREWKELDIVRSFFEAAGIPVSLNWKKSSFPSLARIKENALLLQQLEGNRDESMSASTLLRQLRHQYPEGNIWADNLRSLLTQWKEETSDAPQPGVVIFNYLFESFSEQRRAGTLDNGIFVSTVHSVKGLEFDHVFVLDGSWDRLSEAEMEEERRLYYVAMSRARETLQLFSMEGLDNPHIKHLKGEYLVEREVFPQQVRPNKIPRYELLGMKELFIDYAGSTEGTSGIVHALEAIKPGNRVNLAVEGNRIYIKNSKNVNLGCLSSASQVWWSNKIKNILDAQVLAIVVRKNSDIKDDRLRRRCRRDTWLLPIVEVRYYV